MKNVIASLSACIIVVACSSGPSRPEPQAPHKDWAAFCTSHANCGLCASEGMCAWCSGTNACIVYDVGVVPQCDSKTVSTPEECAQ